MHTHTQILKHVHNKVERTITILIYTPDHVVIVNI